MFREVPSARGIKTEIKRVYVPPCNIIRKIFQQCLPVIVIFYFVFCYQDFLPASCKKNIIPVSFYLLLLLQIFCYFSLQFHWYLVACTSVFQFFIKFYSIHSYLAGNFLKGEITRNKSFLLELKIIEVIFFQC